MACADALRAALGSELCADVCVCVCVWWLGVLALRLSLSLCYHGDALNIN